MGNAFSQSIASLCLHDCLCCEERKSQEHSRLDGPYTSRGRNYHTQPENFRQWKMEFSGLVGFCDLAWRNRRSCTRICQPHLQTSARSRCCRKRGNRHICPTRRWRRSSHLGERGTPRSEGVGREIGGRLSGCSNCRWGFECFSGASYRNCRCQCASKKDGRSRGGLCSFPVHGRGTRTHRQELSPAYGWDSFRSL